MPTVNPRLTPTRERAIILMVRHRVGQMYVAPWGWAWPSTIRDDFGRHGAEKAEQIAVEVVRELEKREER